MESIDPATKIEPQPMDIDDALQQVIELVNNEKIPVDQACGLVEESTGIKVSRSRYYRKMRTT